MSASSTDVMRVMMTVRVLEGDRHHGAMRRETSAAFPEED